MNLTEFGERLVTLSTGAEGLRASLAIKMTPDDEDADVLHMRASDETLDRYDEVILASGWQLDHYRRNPVIQNAHQYGDILFTIGKAEKTEVQEGALIQTWRFAAKENPMAKIARDLYRGRFLNASSVGFIPREWVNGDKKTKCARKYTKAELLEVSAVGIPANPAALALAVKSGCIDKSDLRELAAALRHVVNGAEDRGSSRHARRNLRPGEIENPYTGEILSGFSTSRATEAEGRDDLEGLCRLAGAVVEVMKKV